MDLAKFDATYLELAAVMILLLVLQNWLIQRRQAWFGIFVPLTYIGILVYLAVIGRVITLTDFVFSALGLLGLLAWWISARERRRHKLEDDQSAQFTPWTAADSSASFPPPRTGVRRHFEVGVG